MDDVSAKRERQRGICKVIAKKPDQFQKVRQIVRDKEGILFSIFVSRQLKTAKENEISSAPFNL